MIGELIVGGLVIKWLKDRPDSTTSTSGRSDDEDTTPSLPPVAVMPDLPSYAVEKVWTSEDGTTCIYILQILRGMVYEQPETGERTGEWFYEDSGYIIGDCNEQAFVRASTSVGGTITFKLGDKQHKNVIVFQTLDLAIAKVEEDDAPTSPTDPQKEPEDDGSSDTGDGGLPLQPDYGGGWGNWGSY